MNDYRVCVKSYVVVRARNASDAKAKAELALRKAVQVDCICDDHDRWGERWELFSWQATGKPERIDVEPIE